MWHSGIGNITRTKGWVYSRIITASECTSANVQNKQQQYNQNAHESPCAPVQKHTQSNQPSSLVKAMSITISGTEPRVSLRTANSHHRRFLRERLKRTSAKTEYRTHVIPALLSSDYRLL